jgi:hypothetical protein
MARREDAIWTTVEQSPNHSVAKLIRAAEENQQSWLIEGLWQPNAIVAVHSLEGEFKSILAYQIAEALATGQVLMEKWVVPEPVRVAVLQTEMPDNMVGERLKAMYPEGEIPQNLIVSNYAVKIGLLQKFMPADKFQLIHNWLKHEKARVLVWDTINSVLASFGNPNSEEATARFYSHLEQLPVDGILVVRHDGKPSKDTQLRQSNQQIRGSNLHAEIASAVIQLQRPDRRSNRAVMEIGKLRHDCVPEPIECWFDAGKMRLTVQSPPVAVLQEEAEPLTREELNSALARRFGIEGRVADDLMSQLKSTAVLIPGKRGHERTWALARPADKIAEDDIHPPEICEVVEVVECV